MACPIGRTAANPALSHCLGGQQRAAVRWADATDDPDDDDGPTTVSDSESWFKNEQPSRTCAWVAERPEQRCLTKGEGAIYAFEQCQLTCGAKDVKCADDAAWFKDGQPDKDCVRDGVCMTGRGDAAAPA